MPAAACKTLWGERGAGKRRRPSRSWASGRLGEKTSEGEKKTSEGKMLGLYGNTIVNLTSIKPCVYSEDMDRRDIRIPPPPQDHTWQSKPIRGAVETWALGLSCIHGSSGPLTSLRGLHVLKTLGSAQVQFLTKSRSGPV